MPSIWLLGSSDYSARLAAEKGLPYVFAHHFSGRGTAEALELYRSGVPPLARARRAPHVPDRQRRRRAEPRGGASGSPRPQLLQMVALRTGAAADRRSRWSRRRRRCELADSHAGLVEAMRERWVIGDPGGGGRSAAHAGGDVRRRRGDGQPGRRAPTRGPTPATSPAREQTLRLLPGVTASIRVSEALPTKLALRPNVGLFRGASRLPGSHVDLSTEWVWRAPGMRPRGGCTRSTGSLTGEPEVPGPTGRQQRNQIVRTWRRKKA